MKYLYSDRFNELFRVIKISDKKATVVNENGEVIMFYFKKNIKDLKSLIVLE